MRRRIFGRFKIGAVSALERKDLAKFQGRVLYILSGRCKVGCTNPPQLGASITLHFDVPNHAEPF